MLTFQTAIPGVARLVFGADSRHLAIVGGEPYLEVLNLSTGKGTTFPRISPFRLEWAWLAPTGRLYTALWNRMFQVDDPFGPSAVAGPLDNSLGGPRGVSPDGRIVVATSGTGSEQAMMWHELGPTIRTRWTLPIPNDFNNFAAVPSDGSRLVTVRPDETILERSTATGEILRRYPNTIMIRSFEFTADGERLVARTRTGSPYVWDGGDLAKKPRRVNVKHRRNITDMALHPNGRHALLASKDGPIAVADLGRTASEHGYDWKIGSTESVAVSPDGQLAAALGERGQLVVWDLDF